MHSGHCAGSDWITVKVDNSATFQRARTGAANDEIRRARRRRASSSGGGALVDHTETERRVLCA